MDFAKGELSEKEIDKMLAEVKATHEIEGMYMTKEEERDLRLYLSGEITENQIIERILKSIEQQ